MNGSPSKALFIGGPRDGTMLFLTHASHSHIFMEEAEPASLRVCMERSNDPLAKIKMRQHIYYRFSLDQELPYNWHVYYFSHTEEK